MQDSGVPTKIGTVWANSAASPYINTIPVASSPTNGRASFTDGFPPACFIPVASGGAGPFGGDMNGILQLVTQWLQWVQAGAPESYDGTFQTEIGGYPQNAIIASASTDGLWWLSTANNNVTDPDTGGAGWIGLPLSSWPNLVGSYAVDTGTANAGVVTLSPAPTAYTSLTGAPLRVLKVALANTGNYTINVNGLGAKSLLYPSGDQVPAGDLPASALFTCVYDGSKFQLQSVTIPQQAIPAADLLGGASSDFVSITVGSNLTLAGNILAADPAVGGVQYYTPGVYTFTIPKTSIRVQCWGGGGGSGGTLGTAASSGAGGGGFSEGVISGLTVGGTIAVTVGLGGTAGSGAPTDGGFGGASSVGAYLTCNGGGASGAANGGISTATGDGGTAGGTAATIAITGQNGGTPVTIAAGIYISGLGGSSAFGGGIQQYAAGGTAQNGLIGISPGGGASGGINGGTGAAGGDGAVIISW